MATNRSIHLHDSDNVIVAIDPLLPDSEARGHKVAERIPRGHKMAIEPIEAGAPIRKFGQIIGAATAPIAPGSHVHTHNCGMMDFGRDYKFAQNRRTDDGPAAQARTFEGFRRPGGKVGTRNYIGILTSVNCSASVARFIADAVNRSDLLADYPNVDGVVSFVHGTGCGMAGEGEGHALMERTMMGYATHPNLAGVLMIGLGCEVFQIPRLWETYGLKDHDGLRSMTIQAMGGTRKTVEAGVEIIKEMLPRANKAVREPVPASELSLALQCGGSDGYSGVTANPALGVAADMLVAEGGTAILAETPEIFGAEHLLTRRAVDRAVGEKLIDRIKWWEDYTAKTGGEMNNNPSPGNKAGGLTTILEKSLGAAAKGGTSDLADVIKYAEPARARGLVFMDSPGYDPVSVTGQVASGATVVTFTTGRGSAFGYKPAPSIKLATNSLVYQSMPEDMDINCGDVLDGVSLEDKGREIFNEVLAVASGKRSKSELLGYGDNEFVPWHVGAVM